MHIRDWIARVIRTFLIGSFMVFVATYSSTVFDILRSFASLGPGDNLPEYPDLNFLRNMLFAMGAGGVIAVGSFIVNGIEAKLGKGFLKPSSPPAAKEVDTIANV